MNSFSDQSVISRARDEFTRRNVLNPVAARLLLIACTALVCAHVASAQCPTPPQPDTWQAIGPALATVFTFERDPLDNDVIFIGTHFGGMYKSIDGGQTWCHVESPFSNDVVFTIEIVPTTPRILYVGTQDRGLFRSGDGGLTWEARNNGLPTTVIREIEVDPFNQNTVLAGTFPGIYKSEDEGLTWNKAESREKLLPGVHIEFDPQRPGFVFAGTQGLGVFRSRNGGETWQPFRKGIGKRGITSLAWDVNDPDRLICSAVDGVYQLQRGKSAWKNLSFNLSDEVRIAHVATVPGRPELFASTDQGVFALTPASLGDDPVPSLDQPDAAPSTPRARRQRNGGRRLPNPSWEMWYDVAARRVDGDLTGERIHIAHSLNFFEFTEDLGESFESATDGIQSLFCGALTTIPGSGDSLIFAGTGNDIRVSTEPAVSPAPYPWMPLIDAGGAVFDLAADPDNPGTIYAGTEGNGVLRTLDSGQSWENISNGIVPKQINSIDQSPLDDGTLYVATGAGVYVSENGGDSWIHRAQNQNPIAINAVEADPAFEGWVYYGRADGTYFRSQDFGDNFLPLWQTPAGEQIVDIEVAPFFEHYIVTSSGSLYTSSDQGNNFFRRGQQDIDHAVLCVAVDESRPWIAYVGTRFGGVYRSGSNALKWEQRISGMDTPIVFSLAIDPTDTDVIYAGAIGTVYRSTDSAAHWTPHSTGLPPDSFVVALSIDPQNPESLYAKVIDVPQEGQSAPQVEGIYRSVNRGQSWTRLTNESQFDSTSALFASRTDQGVIYAGSQTTGVYRSQNSGSIWSPANDGLTLIIVSIVIDPNNTDVLYAASLNSGVFKSIDAGQSWTPTGLNDQIIFHLAIDPSDSQKIYAGTALGPMRSLDGGQTWRLAGQESPFILSVAADPVSPETVYAGSFAGECFRSDDGGRSWDLISDGLPEDDFNAITVSPTDGTVYVACASAGVFRSVDQGATWWSADNLIFSGERLLDIDVDPVSGDIFVCTWGSIFRSLDRGDSWFELPTGFGQDYPGSMTIVQMSAETTAIFVAVLNEQGPGIDPGAPVLRSLDGGQSWQVASTGINVTDARAIASGPGIIPPLFAAAVDGVYRSNDLGANWSLANSGLEGRTVSDLFVSRDSSSTVFAATDSGLYRTTNSGDSWQPIQVVPGETVALNRLTGASGGRLVLGAIDRGVFTSEDGGVQWLGGITAETSIITPHALAVDPTNSDRIFVASATGGFAVSEDGGVSWRFSNSGLGTEVLFTITIDPINPNTMYVSSSDQGVWVTDNGGSTWESLNDGLFNHFVTALTIDAMDNRVLYAGTEGGGVFRLVRP